MIPNNVLTAWRQSSPWRTDLQVEQDLVLHVLAIEIANHELVADHLIWRGGTCLHKLHLGRARRYSEDLDYVLISGVDHGDVKFALSEVAEHVGLEVDHYDVTDENVKVWASAEATAGTERVSVMFEVNCNDIAPLLDLRRIPLGVDNRWWSNRAEVLTFDPCELGGTKFRALAQRRKGRDLSDLWMARRELGLEDPVLAAAAVHYLHHEDIDPGEFRVRLADHGQDPDFVRDLDVLAAEPYEGFDPATELHRLILWSDVHLDPLYDERRNPKAVRRDQQQREKDGWREGTLPCPVYLDVDGNLSRCGSWVNENEPCPDHPGVPTSP